MSREEEMAAAIADAESLDEFFNSLYEALSFVDDPDPRKITWRCGKGDDRFFYAKQTCQQLNLDWALLQTKLSELGHYCCDCEIVFDCDTEQWGEPIRPNS